MFNANIYNYVARGAQKNFKKIVYYVHYFNCVYNKKCLNPERRFDSPTPAQTQPLASPRPPPNFEKVKSASHAQTMRGWHSDHGATQTRRQRRAQRVCMVRRILINGRSFEGVFSNACIRAYPDIFVIYF